MASDAVKQKKPIDKVTAARAAVTLDGVTICLGGRIIQKEMNLIINDGEFVAILGPNGAGKTTLLKVLLGLIVPESGRISLLGKAPTRGNREIGYVPQFRVLETDYALRARDVVGFGFDGHRWGPGWPSEKRSTIIDRVLEEVGALAFAGSPVGQLSGGEQQRLLIAQALISNPKLLLLDEPLSNLDLVRAQEIIDLIDRIRRDRHIAALLVTHDINPLLRYVDRVLYMVNGRCAIGAPIEVVTRETLSALYGSPVEVVQALGRVFVVGVET